MTKPYADQTIEERIACLDKIQNVLVHEGWSELYLRFAEDAAALRRGMEDAGSWEQFVATRAVYKFLTENVMQLRERVKAEKEGLEADLLVQGIPLPPPDYETE